MPFSIHSTIGELMDNADTRAFIETHMAELAHHPMLGLAKQMSLKALAPFSGGKLTDATLAQIDAELRKF